MYYSNFSLTNDGGDSDTYACIMKPREEIVFISWSSIHSKMLLWNIAACFTEDNIEIRPELIEMEPIVLTLQFTNGVLHIVSAICCKV